MIVQNTNTRPPMPPASHGPIGEGDIMTMLAGILHQLGNQRGDELRNIAEDQKKIFGRRKELGALQQKLSEIVSNGYINPWEWDEFESMAKDLGFDTSGDIFNFMRDRTRSGIGLNPGGSWSAETLEATDKGLDRVKDNMKFELDSVSDEQTVRQFDLQKAMHAFTTEHGEAKKVLEKMERLA